MKGPFERLKYDLRRIWECPVCGHKQRTDGSITTQFCRCGKNNTNPPIGMRLVGDGPRRLVPRVAPPPREVLVEVTQVDVITVAAVETLQVIATEPILPPADETAGPA